MDASEKADLIIAIQKKIKLTESAIADYKEMTQPVAPDDSIGRLSRMDAINNKSVMEAALREAEAKLKRLLTAQANINDPDFGLCQKCKEPIPIQRLRVMPDSTKCVKCS